ncbi:MAG: serine/threonine-protein kinase [Chlamydiales bacterium]|nr:serine/threonine-protein kinase [Chlamydiales bacterium]
MFTTGKFSSLLITSCLLMSPMFAKKVAQDPELSNLGISASQYAALTKFINTKTNGKIARYNKHTYGLSHTIEYDAETDKYFIVLEGAGVYLDRGMKKVVSKALCVDGYNTSIVARAEQTQEMNRELAITKEFQGRPGLFKTLGICHHQNFDTQYHTIYSKLYQPGSLQKIFQKNYKLTFYETVRIARNIAKGLKTLHAKGVVHRDLGIKNYLINIPKGKPGRRKIVACIADFGRAELAKNIIPDARVQGNTTYMAPEGHFYQNLTKDSYAPLDIFALGCVFYRLYYGKKAPWQDTNYVKKDPRPIKARVREHKARIKAVTETRRKVLGQMKQRTPKQEFEYIILKMLHTAAKKRLTAAKLYKKIDDVYRQL